MKEVAGKFKKKKSKGDASEYNIYNLWNSSLYVVIVVKYHVPKMNVNNSYLRSLNCLLELGQIRETVLCACLVLILSPGIYDKAFSVTEYETS